MKKTIKLLFAGLFLVIRVLAMNTPGVTGDGVNDDTRGIQALLDSKAATIYLPCPPKHYLISKTLKIHSGQTLVVDRNAVIRLADGAGVHMLTNSDHVNGNFRITVIGGIWDGNNLAQTQEYHQTGNYHLPFDANRYLGVLMQFNHVTDLHVADLTLKDPETFGFQAGNLLWFTIENIIFDYNLKRGNMDGIHIHGNSRHGRITNLKGTTNDDMVALNADDAEMFELSRGPITDIQIDGLWSDNGYRAIRLLSCGSPVKRVKISNVFGTYRYEAISLTNHKVHPGCESTFENISITGLFCSNSPQGKQKPQIRIESPATVSNLTIHDWHRTEESLASDNIQVEKGASIGYLALSNVTMTNRCGNLMSVIHNSGDIGSLHMANVYLKGDDTNVQLMQNDGKIQTVNENNVSVDTKPGINFRTTKQLIRIGKPVVAYKIDYLNDHTVVYNPADNKWHLFGIITGEKHFIHLTTDSLMQSPWLRHEDFCVESCDREIWAPHIVAQDGTFYMFYTMIGQPREIRYAVSQDLYEWQYPSAKPLLAGTNKCTDNMKNKDPMVFRHKGKWTMYFSMMKDKDHWVVGYSTSKDLKKWTKPGICFDENTTSPGVESPFVVQRGKYFYLFLSARPWPQGGEDVFRSTTPYLWNPTDQVERIEPWHAAEVLCDLDGKWYLTLASGKESTDFRIAPIVWNDDL